MPITQSLSNPIHTQRLAVIYALVVMTHKRYDPWGDRKNPVTWDTDFSGGLTDRGYTMHEHLDDFGLINMNGRVYDPLLGRFLSPDNYIQSPDNPQNYNRYAYALNNPLKYTDPSGEFFGTVFTGIVDFVVTAFFEGGLDPTSKNARRNAWRDFDPTAEWSPTNKAWQIDKGMFRTDKDKTWAGQFIQIFERPLSPLYWAGNFTGHYHNLSGNVESVDGFYGSTVINLEDNSIDSCAFQLGGHIMGENVGTSIEYRRDSDGNISLDENGNPFLTEESSLLIHEYVHYLQQRAWLNDPFAYLLMGMNSARHNDQINDPRSWAERGADFRATRYFAKKGYSMNGYTWEEAPMYKNSWPGVYALTSNYFILRLIP